MAMNRVQFQAGLSMPIFLARCGTEAKCRRALYRMRWPKGFRCPVCARRKRSVFRREGQLYYQCSACRHQTTLLAGTMFEATKLPLTTPPVRPLSRQRLLRGLRLHSHLRRLLGRQFGRAVWRAAQTHRDSDAGGGAAAE